MIDALGADVGVEDIQRAALIELTPEATQAVFNLGCLVLRRCLGPEHGYISIEVTSQLLASSPARRPALHFLPIGCDLTPDLGQLGLE